MPRASFAVPGDLATPTGGYAYARALLAHAAGAGLDLTHVALPAGFPHPDAAALCGASAALAAAPADRPILIDGLALGALSAAALDGCRAPVVGLVHHPLALETGLDAGRAAALRASEGAALARAARVICPSAQTADQTAALFDLPRDRITVAPPGLTPPPRAEGGAPPMILSIASLTPRKGHDTLLAALGALRGPWRALWAGADALDRAWAADLRARIAAEGLADRIALPGALSGSELAAAWRGASIFCLPSRHEGYGMVYAEALAAELPVIACDIPATRALIPPQAGVLTPLDDADALAAALQSLLDDPMRRACMGAAAAQAAQSLPRWPGTARIVADVLAAVAP